MRSLRLAPAFLVLLLAAACATTGENKAPVSFAQDAQSNIAKGKEAMDDKDYGLAEAYFEEVRTKYPFIEEAKEAELLLADLDFARDSFAAARKAA